MPNPMTCPSAAPASSSFPKNQHRKPWNGIKVKGKTQPRDKVFYEIKYDLQKLISLYLRRFPLLKGGEWTLFRCTVQIKPTYQCSLFLPSYFKNFISSFPLSHPSPELTHHPHLPQCLEGIRVACLLSPASPSLGVCLLLSNLNHRVSINNLLLHPGSFIAVISSTCFDKCMLSATDLLLLYLRKLKPFFKQKPPVTATLSPPYMSIKFSTHLLTFLSTFRLSQQSHQLSVFIVCQTSSIIWKSPNFHPPLSSLRKESGKVLP